MPAKRAEEIDFDSNLQGENKARRTRKHKTHTGIDEDTGMMMTSNYRSDNRSVTRFAGVTTGVSQRTKIPGVGTCRALKYGMEWI